MTPASRSIDAIFWRRQSASVLKGVAVPAADEKGLPRPTLHLHGLGVAAAPGRPPIGPTLPPPFILAAASLLLVRVFDRLIGRILRRSRVRLLATLPLSALGLAQEAVEQAALDIILPSFSFRTDDSRDRALQALPSRRRPNACPSRWCPRTPRNRAGAPLRSGGRGILSSCRRRPDH